MPGENRNNVIDPKIENIGRPVNWGNSDDILDAMIHMDRPMLYVKEAPLESHTCTCKNCNFEGNKMIFFGVLVPSKKKLNAPKKIHVWICLKCIEKIPKNLTRTTKEGSENFPIIYSYQEEVKTIKFSPRLWPVFRFFLRKTTHGFKDLYFTEEAIQTYLPRVWEILLHGE